MTQEKIQIRKAGSRTGLARFRRVADAMRWKADRDLGAEFRIDDLRHPDDPGRAADRPLLVGLLIRDALAPAWWGAQLDRVMDGRIERIPDRHSEGLERETAVFAALCLTEAGASGWRAVEGPYHDPALGPPVLRTHTAAPVHHAWLEHESGAKLDLGDRVFDRLPVTLITPADDRHTSFGEGEEIRDIFAAAVAAAWIERLGGGLVPALRHNGAATMMPRPVVPEVDLDPTP